MFTKILIKRGGFCFVKSSFFKKKKGMLKKSYLLINYLGTSKNRIKEHLN
jgi:hypothetical protein